METRDDEPLSAAKAAIELLLANLGGIAAGVKVDLQGSTLILTGYLSDARQRDVILSGLLEALPVDFIIDSLRGPGDPPSTQVYMTRGKDLSRVIERYFSDDQTWEQYEAARQEAKRHS